MIKQMEKIDSIEKLAQESGHAERFKNLRYVDRGVAEESLKTSASYEVDRDFLPRSGLEGFVDGELSVDLHGNLEMVEHEQKPQEGGLKEPGTYVLRNGKLVPGKGMVRE